MYTIGVLEPGTDLSVLKVQIEAALKKIGMTGSVSTYLPSPRYKGGQINISRPHLLSKSIMARCVKFNSSSDLSRYGRYRKHPATDSVENHLLMMLDLDIRTKGKLGAKISKVGEDTVVYTNCMNQRHKVIITSAGRVVLCDHPKDQRETDMALSLLAGKSRLPRCLEIFREMTQFRQLPKAIQNYMYQRRSSGLPSAYIPGTTSSKLPDEIKVKYREAIFKHSLRMCIRDNKFDCRIDELSVPFKERLISKSMAEIGDTLRRSASLTETYRAGFARLNHGGLAILQRNLLSGLQLKVLYETSTVTENERLLNARISYSGAGLSRHAQQSMLTMTIFDPIRWFTNVRRKNREIVTINGQFCSNHLFVTNVVKELDNGIVVISAIKVCNSKASDSVQVLAPVFLLAKEVNGCFTVVDRQGRPASVDVLVKQEDYEQESKLVY